MASCQQTTESTNIQWFNEYDKIDLGKAVAAMERILQRLEAYLITAPPATPSTP